MADRVIVFGSREYRHPSIVKLRVLKLPEATTVVVGGAAGPDKVAERTARRAGLPIERHRADWQTHGKRAGHIRNDHMASLGASLAIGFWDGHSRGTSGMIKVCKRYGIPLELWDAEAHLLTGEDATLRLWRERH